jgi:hypothetical protein
MERCFTLDPGSAPNMAIDAATVNLELLRINFEILDSGLDSWWQRIVTLCPVI